MSNSRTTMSMKPSLEIHRTSSDHPRGPRCWTASGRPPDKPDYAGIMNVLRSAARAGLLRAAGDKLVHYFYELFKWERTRSIHL
jgi:hypothetical protein